VYEWLLWGGGWIVIGFFEYLVIVTTDNGSAVANSHSAIHCSRLLSLDSLLCVHRLSANGFQQCPLLPCSRSYQLATFPKLPTLNSTILHSTNWAERGQSSDIASKRTQQKTPFLCWCGWRGITCSIAAALSAWCLGRGHTKETGNRNFREISPIWSRQLVSRLAGAHWGNLYFIICSHPFKWVCSTDVMHDCIF
jgi:hypothetical protein